MLFDSHAHLDDARFDEDRDLMMERARQRGVRYIMNPGANLEGSYRSVALSQTYPEIYAAVGIHPHDAKSASESVWQELLELAKNPKVKAIGEIGLDYYYDFSPRDTQKEVFRYQIRMAKSLSLPIIVHDRDAHQDIYDLLVEEDAFSNGVLMHCFSGSAQLAKDYVKRGAYISLAGPLTFKNARKSHEVVLEVPLERLMIETDAPYLTPMPFRGKRNESSYVHYVCEEMARLKHLSYEEVAQATCHNALVFFNIAQGNEA